MNAIELRGVHKRFRTSESLIDDFSLAIAEGESAVIVGPSGSGKTTLLNLVALLEPFDRGELLLGGRSMSVADVGKPRLAYIFQRDALLPWLTVRQNILLGIEAVRRPQREDVDRARAFLEAMGLNGFEDRSPTTLSGGQRQLVAIVQNLMLDPDIFILDEPFSNVDFPTRLFLEREVIRLVNLARESRERPLTLLMVTHDIEEAIVIGSRIIVVGRAPGQSLQVVRDISLDIANSDRDPMRLRGSELLRRHFAEIAECLEANAPVYQSVRAGARR